jgi:hypothetical protein
VRACVGYVRVPKVTEQGSSAVRLLHSCIPEVLASHLGTDFVSYFSPFRQIAVVSAADRDLCNTFYPPSLVVSLFEFPAEVRQMVQRLLLARRRRGLCRQKVVGSWSIPNVKQCDNVGVT